LLALLLLLRHFFGMAQEEGRGFGRGQKEKLTRREE
jgi:hypothetical protein